MVEKDTSASTKRGTKRSSEWERVKALVEDGKADAIVSRHYDRMYRTPWDLEDLVDLAEATSVTLAAAQAQGVLDLSTPSGRLSPAPNSPLCFGTCAGEPASQGSGSRRAATCPMSLPS
ncbi:recombinase family protein [Streptomyces sp. NPDC048002]|uniref:recombinase family protein n=1 Tax=Streptomyces sp. NPDC048002 TaxID=3154344 RepID=UPI0033F500E7